MALFFERLRQRQLSQKTCLSVGLDPNPERFPKALKLGKNGVVEFCQKIVDATAEYVCCYKPQIAYFASQGWESELTEIIAHIKSNYPDVQVILDSKRNDIGTTAEQYAKEAFDRYGADAVTLNPYMGWDSIEPFVSYKERGAFLLCRTSNPAANEMQNVKLENGQTYYEHVANTAMEKWNGNNNIGFVVGATAPDELKSLREKLPTAWFLVPGVGAQGGDLKTTLSNGCFDDGTGLVINSSRGIIFASGGEDFAEVAAQKAKEIQTEMSQWF